MIFGLLVFLSPAYPRPLKCVPCHCHSANCHWDCTRAVLLHRLQQPPLCSMPYPLLCLLCRLQIHRFINARRRTVQPLIDEQNRRYMQSREYSAMSHFQHHPHHQPPPSLALPRLSAQPGVHGDYGVVAAGGGQYCF